jgi:hypothetical protein
MIDSKFFGPIIAGSSGCDALNCARTKVKQDLTLFDANTVCGPDLKNPVLSENKSHKSSIRCLCRIP